MNKEYNYYICRTFSELEYLIKNDCILKKVVDDTNPKYKLFLFADNYKLRQALNNK